MGDRDGVEARPAFPLSQPREHARPAVEKQPPAPFDDVARLGAVRVVPRGRAANDDEFHGPILYGQADLGGV